MVEVIPRDVGIGKLFLIEAPRHEPQQQRHKQVVCPHENVGQRQQKMRHLPGEKSIAAAILVGTRNHVPGDYKPCLDTGHSIGTESNRIHRLKRWMKLWSIDHHFHQYLTHEHIKMGCCRFGNVFGCQKLYKERQDNPKASCHHHVFLKAGLFTQGKKFRYFWIRLSSSFSVGVLPGILVEPKSVGEDHVEWEGDRKEEIPCWN